MGLLINYLFPLWKIQFLSKISEVLPDSTSVEQLWRLSQGRDRRIYEDCGRPTSSLQVGSGYLAQVSLCLNAHTHHSDQVRLCLWKQNSDPILDSLGRMEHPNPTKGIVLRSGSLIPNMLASILQPQVLLRSFFPELSSTWCLTF